jgi:hypothetical protein
MRSRTIAIALAGLVLAVPAAAQSRPTAVPDTAAFRSVGQVVTVEGRVAQVKDAAQHGYAYLNFHAPYPRHAFSVWIPDSVAAKFGDLKRWEGKRLRATGLVWLQNNEWPAMTIVDPTKLEGVP